LIFRIYKIKKLNILSYKKNQEFFINLTILRQYRLLVNINYLNTIIDKLNTSIYSKNY